MSLSARRIFAPLVTACACLAAAAFVSPRPIAASTTPDLAQAVAALQARASVQDARIASLQSTVEHQQVIINTLQKKTAPITLATDTDRADGAQSTEMYFTGVNVHVVDGSGYTNDNGGTLTGLGNLIVGYNETRGSGHTDKRMGSHNLIVGTKANYESFGGVVFGYNNSVASTGHYAVVTGGQYNTASGVQSSVTGGRNNIASNQYASVSGGYGNTASGDTSSISGGEVGVASGLVASISGGAFNHAIYSYCSVSGGAFNTASGNSSSISGGGNNMASALDSSISGGSYNTANSLYASVSGGLYNAASGDYSAVTGGQHNTASGDRSTTTGGSYNTASGAFSTVTGGDFVEEGNDSGFAAGGQYSSSSPGPGVFHSP